MDRNRFDKVSDQAKTQSAKLRDRFFGVFSYTLSDGTESIVYGHDGFTPVAGSETRLGKLTGIVLQVWKCGKLVSEVAR